MNKKAFAIILIGIVCLFCGISVAYYNTKTFAFDKDAKIISYDDEKFSVMDYNIYYDSIEQMIDKAVKFIPDKQFTF